MSNHEGKPDSDGIPEQIIAEFIKQLTAKKLPAELVGRLEGTLLKKKDISEAAIKAALSSE